MAGPVSEENITHYSECYHSGASQLRDEIGGEMQQHKVNIALFSVSFAMWTFCSFT